MNSQMQRSTSGITEMTGQPGTIWGSFVVPASGKITIHIEGDILHTNSRLNYGLESTEVFVPIANITSIEVTEGRIWWLLGLGLATIWFVVGILFIILFFVYKQKWIVIHTSGVSLILFHKNTAQAKQFAQTLLMAMRQSHASLSPRPNPGNLPQRQAQNGQRPQNQQSSSTIS